MEDDLKVLGKRKSKPKVKEDFVSFDQINVAAVKSKEINKTKLKTSIQKNFRCELCSATRFVQGTSEKQKTKRILDIQNNKVLKVCNAQGWCAILIFAQYTVSEHLPYCSCNSMT